MRGRAAKSRLWLAALLGLVIAAPHLASRAKAGLLDEHPDMSEVCGDAVQSAEARYPLPPGLLFAISLVESGRPVDGGSRLRPWPWTVQAENQSHYFASKTAAIRWVQQAEAEGITSIDVGCMQVNLMYHPFAFRTLDEAFDPGRNADYAARFLLSLHAATGDWQEAAGQYHSQTLALAIPYRQRVEALLRSGVSALSPQEIRLRKLRAAWAATLDGDAIAPAQPDLSGDWSHLLTVAEARKVRHHTRHAPIIMLTDAH